VISGYIIQIIPRYDQAGDETVVNSEKKPVEASRRIAEVEKKWRGGGREANDAKLFFYSFCSTRRGKLLKLGFNSIHAKKPNSNELNIDSIQ